MLPKFIIKLAIVCILENINIFKFAITMQIPNNIAPTAQTSSHLPFTSTKLSFKM